MAEDTSAAQQSTGAESTALNEALAASHAAIWGYGVVGAALGEGAAPAAAAEEAHRNLRDRVTALLVDREAEPVGAEGADALPFPVLSEVDAAALAVVLEDGVAATWVRVLDQAAERSTRELAVTALGDAEVRAVQWRAAAGQTPVTTAFPGL